MLLPYRTSKSSTICCLRLTAPVNLYVCKHCRKMWNVILLACLTFYLIVFVHSCGKSLSRQSSWICKIHVFALEFPLTSLALRNTPCTSKTTCYNWFLSGVIEFEFSIQISRCWHNKSLLPQGNKVWILREYFVTNHHNYCIPRRQQEGTLLAFESCKTSPFDQMGLLLIMEQLYPICIDSRGHLKVDWML